MSISIDGGAFRRRIGELQESLESLGADAWVTILGKGDNTAQAITTALHVWLLGYPFANTVFIVTKEQATLIASAKQVKYLEPLTGSRVKIVVRPKSAEESVQVLSKELEGLSGKVAAFAKEGEPQGELGGELMKSVYSKFPRNEMVDGTAAFAALRRAKDESELKAIRTASKAAAGIMTQYFAEEMTSVVDEERDVSTETMAAKVSETIDNTKLLRQLRLGPDFDAGRLDWVEQPEITHDGGKLGAGVTTCELRLQYKNYQSWLARTFLIDAPKEKVELYTALLSVERRILTAATDGATCHSVWEAAMTVAKEKGVALPTSIGYGIGIEAEDKLLEIKEDNSNTLRDGYTLVIRLSVENILLIDTVRVTSDVPIVFTDAPKGRDDVVFEIEDSDEDEKASTQIVPRSQRPPRQARADLKRESTENAELALQAHQRELKQRLQDAGLHKYKADEEGDVDSDEPVFRKYEAYHREQQLPHLETLRIKIDERAKAIILPVSGRPVPFHINTFKNGSVNEEGEYVYVRLNFNSPDSLTQKRDEVPYDNPNAQFIKSVTLRSRDGPRMRDTLKKIQDLKRDVSRRENERKQLADVVQQDKLIEVKDRRAPRLEPVYVRPNPEGKRLPGAVEIHRNGVRFTTAVKEQTVEVLFSNVEHLFYQPSDHELIVLFHFHLRNPIMIGKRKTWDVQFYRDATDMTFDDTGNSRKRGRKYGDEDELEQEREERRHRLQLNKEFHTFAEQISRASNGKLDVDVPFRDLGFSGVPSRSNVLLQPTTTCLVQLTETPFVVLTLAEVELAVLERVRFGLKQFDMVFIYKNYKKPPMQINGIPVTQIDAVRGWLNEVDIPFYQVELNLNWKEVMSIVNSAPHSFFADGGWDNVFGGDDSEGSGGEEEDSDEGEEEFEASDPSDDDDEVSSAESEFSENSFSGDEDEEEGEDWSDLEAEAIREDRKKNQE